MSESDLLSELLHDDSITRTDALLLCIAFLEKPATPASIRKSAIDAGISEARNWNIHRDLNRAKGLIANSNGAWKLLDRGKTRLKELAGLSFPGNRAKAVAVDLRQHLKSISDKAARNFIAEGISCFENHLYRAAIVLSWIGAIAILHDHIYKKHLDDFNNEAKRRIPNGECKNYR